MSDKPEEKVEFKSDRPVKNIMRKRFHDEKREAPEFEERVIEVRRVARTVKGGRRIRFRALIVIGNRKGKIGMGLGKSTDVSEAVRKAVTQAKKNLVIVPIINGTIPYEVTVKHGSAVVMLKPATSGTSIVAGGAVRAVADLAGITDLLSKMLGSASKVNNIIATIKALSTFNPAYTERIREFSENEKAKAIATPVVDAAPEVKVIVEEKVEKKPKAAVKKAAKKSMK
jgi:small subunit ribosomal protein S5